jgi:hypothetical protein
MSKTFLITIASVIIISLYSCKMGEEKISSVSDSLAFKASTLEDDVISITDPECIAIISRQQIVFGATIKNKSGDRIALNPELWELHCSDGSRTLPIKVSGDEYALNPGASAKIMMFFEPVHDRQLYQQTGLRGDIDSHYRLQCNVNTNKLPVSQEIFLEANKKNYQDAISAFGLTKTTKPYAVAEMSSPGNDKQEKDFSIDPVSSQDNIRMSDNEILANGFWTRFASFYKSDTLFVTMRMVNQSLSPVVIHIPELKLLFQNEFASPFISGDSTLMLRNGSRAELKLKFHVRECSRYEMALTGIQQNTGKPLIDHRVIFTPFNFSQTP